MYLALKQIGIFHTYLYSMWQDYSVNQIINIANLCRKNHIQAVTISKSNWSKQIQHIFDENGIYVYVYTVNNLSEARQFINEGALGICTDMITKDLLF